MVLIVSIFGALLRIRSILSNCSYSVPVIGNYGRSKTIILTVLEKDCEHNFASISIGRLCQTLEKSQYQKIGRHFVRGNPCQNVLCELPADMVFIKL